MLNMNKNEDFSSSKSVTRKNIYTNKTMRYGNEPEYGILDFDGTFINGDISHAFSYTVASRFDFQLLPIDFTAILYHLTDGKEEFFKEIADSYLEIYKFGKRTTSMARFLGLFERFYQDLYRNFNKDFVWAFLHQWTKEDLLAYQKIVLEQAEIYERAINKKMFHPISLFQPIQSLVKFTLEKNFAIHIVTASPRILVESFLQAQKTEFSELLERVAGVELLKEDDRYTYFVDENAIYTIGEGKVDLINKIIKPYYKGKDPLFVAGDGSGDVPMLTAYNETTKNILIDRNRKGKIAELITSKQQKLEESSSQFLQVNGFSEVDRNFLILKETNYNLEGLNEYYFEILNCSTRK